MRTLEVIDAHCPARPDQIDYIRKMLPRISQFYDQINFHALQVPGILEDNLREIHDWARLIPNAKFYERTHTSIFSNPGFLNDVVAIHGRHMDLCGFFTADCIEVSIKDGLLRNLKIEILEELCFPALPQEQAPAFDRIGLMLGRTIMAPQ